MAACFDPFMQPANEVSCYRFVMGFFIVALMMSGLTAFPLLHELRLLCSMAGIAPGARFEDLSEWQQWLFYVRLGLDETYSLYPFIGYGTDWLAFGHLVISLFFIEPWRKPGTCQGNLIVGMIACVAIVPLALICGAIRGIPLYWRLIDCSFGVVGIVPLFYCWRIGRRLRV